MTATEPAADEGTPATPVPARPRLRPLAWWLVPTGVLAVLAIGVLWALPRPAQVCIMIYPTPPECLTGGDPSGVIPFLVLIVLVYAAIVTCGLLVPAHRRALVLGLLTGALGLVIVVGVLATLAAANTGYYY
jgi:hypothetical protein